MTEIAQSFEGQLSGEKLHEYRVREMAEIEDQGLAYRSLKKKERGLLKLQVGAALAPLAVGGALMTTELVRNTDNWDKSMIGLYSIIAAGLAAGAAWARRGTLDVQAVDLAVNTARRADKLGIARDPWMNEGIQKKKKLEYWKSE